MVLYLSVLKQLFYSYIWRDSYCEAAAVGDTIAFILEEKVDVIFGSPESSRTLFHNSFFFSECSTLSFFCYRYFRSDSVENLSSKIALE